MSQSDGLAQGTSGNDTDHIDWDVLAEERLGQRPRTEHGRHIPQTSPAPGDDSGSPSAQGAPVWPRPVLYDHDAKGNIVLPEGVPFDGEPVLIKVGAGWVEARWEGGDFWGWVCLDDSAPQQELDDAREWMPLPAARLTPAAFEGAVIAWDCASEEYREGAYKQMALEIQQLRAQLEQLQFGIAAVSFAMGWTDVCGKTNEEFARDLRRERDLALAQVERTSGFTDEQLEDLRAHIRGAQPADTYDYELGSGWRCFHCGETFRTPGGASLHFGKPIDKRPVCLSNPSTVGAPK